MVLYIGRARLQTSEFKVNRQTALRRKSLHLVYRKQGNAVSSEN